MLLPGQRRDQGGTRPAATRVPPIEVSSCFPGSAEALRGLTRHRADVSSKATSGPAQQDSEAGLRDEVIQNGPPRAPNEEIPARCPHETTTRNTKEPLLCIRTH